MPFFYEFQLNVATWKWKKIKSKEYDLLSGLRSRAYHNSFNFAAAFKCEGCSVHTTLPRPKIKRTINLLFAICCKLYYFVYHNCWMSLCWNVLFLSLSKFLEYVSRSLRRFNVFESFLRTDKCMYFDQFDCLFQCSLNVQFTKRFKLLRPVPFIKFFPFSLLYDTK